VLQEFDFKKRKIRSIRGFFLYALEIMQKDYEILRTNLQPFFWKNVKNIIRQNKKGALHEFLFASPTDTKSAYESSNPNLEDKIAALESQVNLLQDRVSHLETTLENPKYTQKGS
jgi:hypothetical protein